MMEQPSTRSGSISEFHGCFIKLPRKSICHFSQVKCSLKGHLWIFMRRHRCLLVIILERPPKPWQPRGRTSQTKGIWTHFIVHHTISLELSNNQICATNRLREHLHFIVSLQSKDNRRTNWWACWLIDIPRVHLNILCPGYEISY